MIYIKNIIYTSDFARNVTTLSPILLLAESIISLIPPIFILEDNLNSIFIVVFCKGIKLPTNLPTKMQINEVE